jgi:tetratricopeptide (TPR) repeat protein
MDYKAILENNTVDQLREIARKAGVSKYSNCNKAELIQKIIEHFKGDEIGLKQALGIEKKSKWKTILGIVGSIASIIALVLYFFPFQKGIDYDKLARKVAGTKQELANLGLAYYKLKQYKLAEEYFKKALRELEKFLGNDHPNTKTVRKNLEMVQSRLTPKGG